MALFIYSGSIVYKSGELASNNLGVYAVKKRIFVAIRPQFDDDLKEKVPKLGNEKKFRKYIT